MWDLLAWRFWIISVGSPGTELPSRRALPGQGWRMQGCATAVPAVPSACELNDCTAFPTSCMRLSVCMLFQCRLKLTHMQVTDAAECTCRRQCQKTHAAVGVFWWLLQCTWVENSLLSRGGEQPSPNFTNDKIQVGHFFMLLGDFPLSVTLQVSNLRFCLVMEVGCPIRVFICCSIQRQLCNRLDILYAMLSPLLHLSLESVFFLTTASISEQGLIRQRWEFVLVSL